MPSSKPSVTSSAARTPRSVSSGNWDTAAGVLIAREAGAMVVDLDGSHHTMNSRGAIAAGPKILGELVMLITDARQATEHTELS